MMRSYEAQSYRAQKIEELAKKALSRINVRELDEQIREAIDSNLARRFRLYYPMWIDEGDSKEMKRCYIEFEALLLSRGYKIWEPVHQLRCKKDSAGKVVGFVEPKQKQIGYIVDIGKP